MLVSSMLLVDPNLGIRDQRFLSERFAGDMPGGPGESFHLQKVLCDIPVTSKCAFSHDVF